MQVSFAKTSIKNWLELRTDSFIVHFHSHFVLFAQCIVIARPLLLERSSLTTYLLLIITDQFGCVLIIFVEAGRAGITISSVEDRLGLVFSSCLAV